MRFLLAALLLFTAPALADENTPLFYTRTHLVLTRNHMPAQDPTALPWQTQPEEQVNPNLTFDIEVRDGMSLYNQQGWFNLSSPDPKSGVLLAFNSPGIMPVVPSQQYKPLDILMIDKEGKITQIVPNIQLSQLQQDIYPSNPVLAFFVIRGGSCAEMSINLGDTVDYKIFVKPPLVLSAPPAPVPATATPPAPPVGAPPLPVKPQKAVQPSKATASPMMMNPQ